MRQKCANPQAHSACTQTEIWADVPSLPGYQASTHGRVRTLDRVVQGRNEFGPCQRRIRGQIIKQSIGKHTGYPVVAPSVDGVQKQVPVHQLVLEAFSGPRPGKNYDASHMDGTRTNNRIENLVWEPTKTNMNRRIDHGTHSPNLTPEAVRVIRRLLQFSDMGLREIGDVWGVLPGVVSSINTQATWNALPDCRGPKVCGNCKLFDSCARFGTQLNDTPCRYRFNKFRWAKGLPRVAA